jgi:hypothetical protein
MATHPKCRRLVLSPAMTKSLTCSTRTSEESTDDHEHLRLTPNSFTYSSFPQLRIRRPFPIHCSFRSQFALFCCGPSKLVTSLQDAPNLPTYRDSLELLRRKDLIVSGSDHYLDTSNAPVDERTLVIRYLRCRLHTGRVLCDTGFYLDISDDLTVPHRCRTSHQQLRDNFAKLYRRPRSAKEETCSIIVKIKLCRSVVCDLI